MFNRIIQQILVIIFKLLHRRRGALPRPLPSEIKKVLLISTTGLGDSIIATPSFAAARQRWPEAEIHVLLHKRWVSLFKACPHFDGIIVYPGKFKQVRSLIRRLRETRPDLALIIHGNDPDIPILAWLSGAAFIAGRAASRFSFLMDQTVEYEDPKRHYTERFLDVVRAAGGDIKAGGEILFLPEDKLSWAAGYWREKGLGDEDRLVILNPGGSSQAKKWPESHWKDLILKLNGRDGIRLALFGSPAEAPVMEKLAEEGRDKTVFVEARPDILEAAALLSRASLLIGPDSGLAHAAVSLDIPAMIMFGPDDPDLSGPYFNRSPAVVLQAGGDVCPELPGCRKKNCTPNRCLIAITPEMVLSALENDLKFAL